MALSGTCTHLTCTVQIRRQLDGFGPGFRDAEEHLARAKRKGVEVSEAEFKLRDVNTLLVSVKNLTHGLDASEIEDAVSEGEKALDETKFRRRGLAVTTALLAHFGVAPALKIRHMGRARRDAAGPHGPAS